MRAASRASPDCEKSFRFKDPVGLTQSWSGYVELFHKASLGGEAFTLSEIILNDPASQMLGNDFRRLRNSKLWRRCVFGHASNSRGKTLTWGTAAISVLA